MREHGAPAPSPPAATDRAVAALNLKALTRISRNVRLAGVSHREGPVGAGSAIVSET